MIKPYLIENVFPLDFVQTLTKEISPIAVAKQQDNPAHRALLGDAGVLWKYTNGKDVVCSPWTSTSLVIKDIIEKRVNREFNSATAYVYQGGGKVHPHSDYRYISNIGGDFVVVCSFGASRFIKFSDDDGTLKSVYEMVDGSALVIPKEYDMCHLHAVPQQPGLRVSLTFREML